jgi:hypothetical protein
MYNVYTIATRLNLCNNGNLTLHDKVLHLLSEAVLNVLKELFQGSKCVVCMVSESVLQ